MSRKTKPDPEAHVLHQILEELRHQSHLLRAILKHLSPVPAASTAVTSQIGEVSMSQSTLKSLPGSDTLSFQTFDNSTPPVDITSRCSYSATSDGSAVSFGAVSGASVPATYSAGTANITISTVDSGGDTIPPVILAATIVVPPAGTTTVSASNPATKIA